jgi:hypothetical protein
MAVVGRALPNPVPVAEIFPDTGFRALTSGHCRGEADGKADVFDYNAM